MRLVCFVILLMVVAAVVVFAVQNNESVTIQYLDRRVCCPMSLLIAVVYLLGMVSGWTVVGFLKRSFRRVADRPKD